MIRQKRKAKIKGEVYHTVLFTQFLTSHAGASTGWLQIEGKNDTQRVSHKREKVYILL